MNSFLLINDAREQLRMRTRIATFVPLKRESMKTYSNMLKKHLYTAPAAEPFVVQAEGMICTSDLGDPGATGQDWNQPGLGFDYDINIL